jgi:hypothetical protein
MKRRARALRRRYGRHAHGSRKEAGMRSVDEMIEQMGALTVRAPRMTMKEQVQHDRRLREMLQQPESSER